MPFISASKRWTYEKFRDNDDDDGFNSCRVSDSLGSKKKNYVRLTLLVR